MTEKEFLEYMKNGGSVEDGSDLHSIMHELSRRAMKITAELNGSYHEADEIRGIFSRLIGHETDEGFGLFPPFSADCGLNITLGKNVFINSGCRFQDWGGITIGDGVLIGHNVVIATINHDLDPAKRGSMRAASVKIGNNVWIGSNATIWPGAEIGDGAVIAAGAVVRGNVAELTVAAGVPAREIKKITV